MEILLNKYQSSLEELKIEELPKELQESFYNFFYNVPLIQNMVNEKRPRAKDLKRDSEGKIIVDITKPHILEDMDYFRQPAIHYQNTGKYTDLRPNPNPNSEFGKWIREEVRRCHEGLIRPSDGEWIPGDLYFFWNYAPMSVSKKDKKSSKKSNRVLDFPRVWDGHYLKFHYLHQARNSGKHAVELASRQKGKSFSAASLLTKRFVLGESYEVNKKVTCYATAAEKGYLVKGDQTLDKFQYNIDFLADNTEFPRKRLINTIQNMQWIMGYQDLDTGTKKGTLNSVMGVTSKDDESKLRGTRGVLYIIEEAGSFPRLLDLWGNLLPSVEDNGDVYGILYAYGTAGDSQSDFYAMSEMMYHPKGYHIYGTKNVYDLEGKGGPEFAFFFPGYMNLANCYDDNGNSDITKALVQILKERFILKYNSTDINALHKKTAEIPIVPQEAIMKSKGNLFPVTDINERLVQLDGDPHSYDDVYIGTLVQKPNGKIEFELTNDTPIREFPHKDNKLKGALEIYQMPEKDSNGNVVPNRYIIANDPTDKDEAASLSLCSILVLDLFTDKIVAEYTGRLEYAEDNYELLRKLCLFYNAQCLYENNISGTYAYFSKMRCTYLLADTPEFLKDKDLIKSTSRIGNTSKGLTATKPINDYADRLIREWLIQPKVIHNIDADGNEVETSIANLFFIKNRALLKELSNYDSEHNFDRVRCLGLLMIYRESYMVIYEGNVGKQRSAKDDPNYRGNDSFFTRNYDKKLLSF
jgi:hypothetical protein